MLLTEMQLYQIRQIVMDHHAAFIVNTVSPAAVAPEVLQRLKDKGLVNVKVSSIEDAYLYGQILAMMDDPKFAHMSYEEFKQHVQKNPIPLTQVEQQAVKFSALQAGQHCVGLGNKVGATIGSKLIEADAAQRQKLRDIIRTKTAENIEKRESLNKLKSELGWATRDWARDWKRIANTEKQNAMQRGVADHYAKRFGGDVFVAKRAMPDSCRWCKKLHVGPDGHPRIFKLSELEANGTNVGRKASEWLPVVGTVHPHCACALIRVPDGWGFDEESSLVPGGEYGKRYEGEEDLKLSMLQEMDLQKAFQLEGRMQFQGIPIAIENKVGSVRKWKDGAGGEGQTKMLNAYGYIERTTGADEDEIDVFIGPDPRAEQVYIIHQRNVHTDLYDEDKTMLGFSNEKDAMAAYQAHYDRPDFVITCSVMDIDAFKRWVQSTDAAPGEMYKSGTGGVRYVIPLEESADLQSRKLAKSQAGKLASEAVGSSSAAARGPVSGTGANYQDYASKPHERPPPVEGVKETLQDLRDSQASSKAVKRDKEVYHFTEPQRYVRPIDTPEAYKSDALEGKETEERRKNVQKFLLQNRGATKNTIDPEKSKQDELKKSKGGGPGKGKGVTPIGGITPGGKLKLGVGHYVDPPGAPEGKHGIFAFAEYHGGKIVDHFEDKSLKVLKIPKAKVEELHKFKAQHGLGAEVGVGGKYAMLSVSIDEIKSLEGVTPKKAKVKAPKEPKPEQKPLPGIPVPSTKGERQGDIQLVSESSMTPPKPPPWLLQNGQAVTVTIGGKEVQGTVVGSHNNGTAAVRIKGEIHRGLKWKHQVKPSGAKAEYKPAYAGLPKDSYVRPDARQKKLLDQSLALNVVGGHKGTEYADWLRKNGQEVYLVGGIVRDLFAGTQPSSKMTDAEVLESMKDVDIVSTASPNLGKAMFYNVAPEKQNGGISNDSSLWGIVLAQGDGVGLDFSSMSTKDDLQTKNMVWDHSIEDDVSRRDFTCNSLYYDPHNDVVIDPTGNGIADAQNKVLRMAPGPEEAFKNDRLHIRFWKFRARGYSAEAETLKYMRKHAKHYFMVQSEKPHRQAKDIYNAIGAKGGNIHQKLADFREAMKADGCEDLYNKYIRDKTFKTYDGKITTVEQAILAYGEEKG